MEEKSYALEYEKVDEETVLITKGFNYRNTYSLGSKMTISIDRVEGVAILHPEGGIPFIPLCAQSDETIKTRAMQQIKRGIWF